ncbi:MAG: indolepyruvate ferredoxin oxidoreductase subunit alpha [Lachnospiraceae bacterium]|nr:indolepyruvate ferredoxin oxidoreductase subunit alpha [Lachnospiraceae bacterium]
MHKEFLMGNEAIALGALAAGVNVVAGYPGTPSTEVLETIAKRNPGNVYVEWSINEKAGMEVAAGAAYAGARTLVTMKQVGLNVASDPLMSLEYIGVKGGMVVLVADDPGPISSQTEQDTRTFGMFSKVPVFDPCSVRDAYEMIQEAFEVSEKYGTPVIFRATTRVDHGYEALEVKDVSEYQKHEAEGFIKDSARWVIFPRLSVKNHALIEKRNVELSDGFSEYQRNMIVKEKEAGCRKGIATQGANFGYVLDSMGERNLRVLRVATPFPFPERLALSFLEGLDEVLCVEELDPVIERALTYVCGKYGLNIKIRGKKTGDIPLSGENTLEIVDGAMGKFLGEACGADDKDMQGNAENMQTPALPVRPPVLCAGCPHRASFYAVKVAMKGQKTIYCGDIGCYTLGNAQPLDMCDTCLCMGAGIGIAQGVYHTEPDTKCFAFVGDSTFFASGITETINAFYNQADMTLVILDNSTTAMTGHQPHPGTGRTVMGQVVEKVSMEKVLRAIGLTVVETVDPLDYQLSVETVKRVAAEPGVKAIIFRSPCIAITKPAGRSKVDAEKCIGCGKCIRELGCPALILDADGKKAKVDTSLCTGCTLCEQICPVGAINGGCKNDTAVKSMENGGKGNE